MSTLEEDIARIAALRRRPADDYQVGQRMAERAARGMDHAVVLDLAAMGDSSRRDMEHFDHLPPWSRALLVNAAVPLNSVKYLQLLERCEDEAWLIRTVERNLPEMVRRDLAKKYGRYPTHPRLEDEDHGNRNN